MFLLTTSTEIMHFKYFPCGAPDLSIQHFFLIPDEDSVYFFMLRIGEVYFKPSENNLNSNLRMESNLYHSRFFGFIQINKETSCIKSSVGQL